jgi:catechol 2,3-dioxygenase-like lactoylglutathione lyase family enzyme
MKFLDRYPIFITPLMRECADFWTRHLGFVEGFANDWITWLTTEDGSASIAFMTPDHPSAPPGPEVFAGPGMCFELQVESIEAAHAEVLATGLVPEYPLTDEPFGQRRFGFHDPAGLWIDIVEQLEPEAA